MNKSDSLSSFVNIDEAAPLNGRAEERHGVSPWRILGIAVASVALAVFVCDIPIVGLALLGMVSLPFSWPVALGLLGGSMIVGLIAGGLLAKTGRKGPVDGIDGCIHHFTVDKHINPGDVKAYFIPALTKTYRGLVIQVNLEGSNDLYTKKWRDGEELDDPNIQPNLTICNVNVKGKGYANYIWNTLRGNKKEYAEDHCVGFIIDHDRELIEYFDSKSTKMLGALEENGTGETVEAISKKIKGNFQHYTFRVYGNRLLEEQVQENADSKSCGIHFCRRVMAFAKERLESDGALDVPSFLPPLNRKDSDFIKITENIATMIGYWDKNRIIPQPPSPLS